MPETPSDFHDAIQTEKRGKISNLADSFSKSKRPSEEDVREFFASRNVDPETVAEFFRLRGESAGRIDGSFPQIRFEERSAETVQEILDAFPEGFKSPEELMTAICAYVRHKMHYDALTVLFTIPEGDESAISARLAFANPRAKFAVSAKSHDALLNFVMNVRMNGSYTPRETAMLTEFSASAYDPKWLGEQLKKPEFRALLDKIAKRSGNFVFNAESEGLLRTNEKASREVFEILNSVKVGVCRDFAMLAKRIYEKMAPERFPESEAIYVNNYEKRHAYVLLAYKDAEGKMQKAYYDPTSFITGGKLRQEKKRNLRERQGGLGEERRKLKSVSRRDGERKEFVRRLSFFREWAYLAQKA